MVNLDEAVVGHGLERPRAAVGEHVDVAAGLSLVVVFLCSGSEEERD